MNISRSVGILLMAVVALVVTRASATPFQNLDFEEAFTSAGFPGMHFPPSQPGVDVDGPFALPHWTTTNYSPGKVIYDTIALDSAAVSVHDVLSNLAQSSQLPLEGDYSVLLQAGSSAGQPSRGVSIAQIGDVPLGTMSLRLMHRSVTPHNFLEITVDGVVIPMIVLSNVGGLEMLGGDISSFAGMAAELKIEARIDPNPPNFTRSWNVIDAIEFSPVPVPEPGAGTLGLVGSALLALTVFARRNRWRD